MIKEIIILLIFWGWSSDYSCGQNFTVPDTISVRSAELTLKALLWRLSGEGSFPTIIFCHGSYETTDTKYDPVEQISILGPVFLRKGYIFLVLFRRGVGLSKGQGENSADLMADALREKGLEERNKVQLQQLNTDQLQDMISGLAFLRNRKDVVTNRNNVRVSFTSSFLISGFLFLLEVTSGSLKGPCELCEYR